MMNFFLHSLPSAMPSSILSERPSSENTLKRFKSNHKRIKYAELLIWWKYLAGMK